ncbi:unnamed protein product [Arabidopsis halleri]
MVMPNVISLPLMPLRLRSSKIMFPPSTIVMCILLYFKLI